MLLPIRFDSEPLRRPVANWILIGLTVVAFGLTTERMVAAWEHHPLMLDGLGIGLLGHTLLHADIVHLLANMWMLWLFGNTVCGRIGNGRFLACYVVFAIGSALGHLATSDSPMIGVENLTLTPHLGAMAADTFEPTVRRMFDNIARVSRGEPVPELDSVVD